MTPAEGGGNVTPNGERLDAPEVKVVTSDIGLVFESVHVGRTTLDVYRNGMMDCVHIGTTAGAVFIPRADLQRLLPALTLYANTGSMVAEEATKPERHDGCNGGVV